LNVLADVFRPDDRIGETSRKNVDEVDDGSERVIELVRNVGRHHAHGHFAFPLAADIAGVGTMDFTQHGHGTNPAVRREMLD
jgi:hypothetical protein